MDKPAEILVFDFFTAAIAAAVSGDVLFGVQLHDTQWQTITKPKGIRISEAVSELAPGVDGVWKEFDADLIVTCWVRVGGVDKTERQSALIELGKLQEKVTQLMFEDTTLGGRVCDLLINKAGRGYDVYDGDPYAVVNIPVRINPKEFG